MLDGATAFEVIRQLLILLGGTSFVGGASVGGYFLLRKLYYAEVNTKNSTAAKQNAEAEDKLAEANKKRIEAAGMFEGLDRNKTAMSLDQVESIIKGYGELARENTVLEAEIRELTNAVKDKEIMITEQNGVVNYQRIELKDAREEMIRQSEKLGEAREIIRQKDIIILQIKEQSDRHEKILRDNGLIAN